MDDIIALAQEAGINSPDFYKLTVAHMSIETLVRFAALAQAAERNKLASWMMEKGYATGHGDTMEGLLEELGGQAIIRMVRVAEERVKAERERLKSAAECFRMCEHKGVCNEKAKSNEAD
jgi:hypothetical protein